MSAQDAVIWSYRLFLNRDPENDAVVATHANHYEGPGWLRSLVIRSGEYLSCLDRAGAVFVPRLPLDWAEGVAWGYRLLLDREPTPDEIAHHLVAPPVSLNALRLRFVTSREFEIKMGDAVRLLQDFCIFNAFAPFPQLEAIPDAYREFIGTVTPIRFLNHAWRGLAGRVFSGPPREAEHAMHPTSEWVGTLRSVIEAGETFTAMELGAGWGPWLAASYKAARLRGIETIALTGVEGSADHYDFLRENMTANGIPDATVTLHHAVVGANDGTASFPKLTYAVDDYGANAVFAEGERGDAELRGTLETVTSISLNTLLADTPMVDLIHIDIQGHEEAVIRAGIEAMNAKVRRAIIGTHSRAIEGNLLDLMQDNGWFCEYEVPCGLMRTETGKLVLVVDGEQMWRNDRL